VSGLLIYHLQTPLAIRSRPESCRRSRGYLLGGWFLRMHHLSLDRDLGVRRDLPDRAHGSL